MSNGQQDPADCDCDANPYHMCCLAALFPWVVENAANRLESEHDIALGQAARRRLYRHGNEHVDAFRRELSTPEGHDRAVEALLRDLFAAGVTHGDPERPISPPRVDLDRLDAHLANGGWLPRAD